MWMIYGHQRVFPVPKPEPKAMPSETVEALVEAAESVQDKFDADPELKDLYHDGFSSLLDEIAKNVKTPIVENEVKVWEIK
jgi:uncharacterized protein with ParB-like and HNH nuclease domain